MTYRMPFCVRAEKISVLDLLPRQSSNGLGRVDVEEIPPTPRICVPTICGDESVDSRHCGGVCEGGRRNLVPREAKRRVYNKTPQQRVGVEGLLSVRRDPKLVETLIDAMPLGGVAFICRCWVSGGTPCEGQQPDQKQ